MIQKLKAVTLKSANAMMLQATLRDLDPRALAADLAQAGTLDFEWTPVLLDTTELDPTACETADWAGIKRAFASVKLNAIALDSAAYELAARIQLAALDLCNPRPVATAVPQVAPEAPQAPAEPSEITSDLPAMVVDAPVRTGTVIYAKGRDLIVTGSVSVGAEVIADGNLTVFGRLQGRAMAGASGRTDARIFAMDFQPDLVSIAGVYEQFEAGPPSYPAGRLLEVSLQDGRLRYLNK